MDLCIVYHLHPFVLASRSLFLMDRSRALRSYRVVPAENTRIQRIFNVYGNNWFLLALCMKNTLKIRVSRHRSPINWRKTWTSEIGQKRPKKPCANGWKWKKVPHLILRLLKTFILVNFNFNSELVSKSLKFSVGIIKKDFCCVISS